MGQLEKPEADKTKTTPALNASSADIVASKNEHITIRPGCTEAVTKREEDLFGKETGFKFTQNEPKISKIQAVSKEDKTPDKKVLDFEEKTPAHPAPKPKALSGMEEIIQSSKEYWQAQEADGRKEGGILGASAVLGAQAMGFGVEAFKAGHNLLNEVCPDGIAAPAKEFWQGLAKEGEAEGGLLGRTKQRTGEIMEGFVDLSGIGALEKGTDQVVEDLRKVVPENELKDHTKSLAIDTLLVAATVLPGFTGVKAIARGDELYKTARAGTEIAGMIATEARAAETVAGKLAQAATEALPQAGEKLSKASLENFVAKLKDVAKHYGIELKEGGMIGESNGGIDAISFSSKAGGPHEVVHAAQQIQTRATALEFKAAELGKSVSELSQAERAEAFNKIVKPFEDMAYNQHEMWAGEAHSWGKTSAQYRDLVMANWQSFEKALSTGTVPEAAVSAASRAYGSLANWLGRSQLEIAKNLGAPTAYIEGKQWHKGDGEI